MWEDKKIMLKFEQRSLKIHQYTNKFEQRPPNTLIKPLSIFYNPTLHLPHDRTTNELVKYVRDRPRRRRHFPLHTRKCFVLKIHVGQGTFSQT